MFLPRYLPKTGFDGQRRTDFLSLIFQQSLSKRADNL
jgi:hypothetical protein